MIANYKFNFLYIHIQKTAGTSIQHRLMKLPSSHIIYNSHTRIKDIEFTPELANCFIFAFVRNPWDRLVSWYNMSIQKGPVNAFHKYTLENSKNFSEFLNCTDIIDDYLDNTNHLIQYKKSIAFNQIDYISDKSGKIMADYIGRFENLNEDFKIISDIIGIKNVTLPHLNTRIHPDYREYYSAADAEKVFKMYKKDIEYFNYTF